MNNYLKKDLMIKSGLGEEVLSSLKKERKIKFLTSKLQKMIDDNLNTEEMSREIVNIFMKDENYE